MLKAVSVFARPQAVTAAHFKTENAVRGGGGSKSPELQLSISSWTCRCRLREHVLSHYAAFLIPILKTLSPLSSFLLYCS